MISCDIKVSWSWASDNSQFATLGWRHWLYSHTSSFPFFKSACSGLSYFMKLFAISYSSFPYIGITYYKIGILVKNLQPWHWRIGNSSFSLSRNLIWIDLFLTTRSSSCLWWFGVPCSCRLFCWLPLQHKMVSVIHIHVFYSHFTDLHYKM